MPVTVQDLLLRDGPGCVWCGRVPWERDLTLEHLVPRARGGHMTAENAVVACRTCNGRRGARPVDAYVRDLTRNGYAVRVAVLRRALQRLAASDRRRHREPGRRQLERLDALDLPDGT